MPRPTQHQAPRSQRTERPFWASKGTGVALGAETPGFLWIAKVAGQLTADESCQGRPIQALQPQVAGHNLAVSSMCELNSTFRGQDRQADKFRLVAYPTAKGCAAEANTLIRHEN